MSYNNNQYYSSSQRPPFEPNQQQYQQQRPYPFNPSNAPGPRAQPSFQPPAPRPTFTQPGGSHPSHTPSAPHQTATGQIHPGFNPSYSGGASNYQQPPQSMYQQNPTLSQQNQQTSFMNGNPNMGNFMGDMSGSAVGQIGLQLGTQAFAQVQQNVNQNINRYVNVSEMRYYFNVSHSYVMNKLLLLFFPFRQKTWTRIAQSDPSGKANYFAPPREDLNAPDLYIPVMAFITYILLVALSTGLTAGNKSSTFTPEILGRTASSAFFLVVFELLFIKFGFYILNVSSESSSFFDLIAFCGYKFVAINTSLLLKFVIVSWIIYAFFSYFMFALGFFLLRSMRSIVISEPNEGDVHSRPNRKRRILFLFSICVVQILTSWLLL